MTGALLEKIEKLLDKGKFKLIIIRASSLNISDGLDIAVEVGLLLRKYMKSKNRLNSIRLTTKLDENRWAEIESALDFADLERKNVNFDLIKTQEKTRGGSIEDTQLIGVILIDKNSHV